MASIQEVKSLFDQGLASIKEALRVEICDLIDGRLTRLDEKVAAVAESVSSLKESWQIEHQKTEQRNLLFQGGLDELRTKSLSDIQKAVKEVSSAVESLRMAKISGSEPRATDGDQKQTKALLTQLLDISSKTKEDVSSLKGNIPGALKTVLQADEEARARAQSERDEATSKSQVTLQTSLASLSSAVEKLRVDVCDKHDQASNSVIQSSSVIGRHQ
jgi:hypothetical protein